MSGDSKKGKAVPEKVSDTPEIKKTCFVIMPIADHPDYPVGHFGRVYDYIIKPACIKAGFIPDRADDAQHTHVIMMNILQRILSADIALCDLSSKNPNVMYELGIRQAFDKPVTLIKDDKTSRVFDTGMLSDVEYTSDLRIDNVQLAIDAIALRIQNTYEKKDEQVNSLIQLMRIEPAKPPKTTVVSSDTNVVLDAIAVLGRRISALESSRSIDNRPSPRPDFYARSTYFRVLFNSYSEKVDDFISAFTKEYPAKVQTITNDDGSFKVEFDFEEPVRVFIPFVRSLQDNLGIRYRSAGCVKD